MQTIDKTDTEATPSGLRAKVSEVFGFRIGVMPAVRRLWSPKIKQHVITLLTDGDFSTAQIAKECDVKEALVAQWEQDVALWSKTERRKQASNYN